MQLKHIQIKRIYEEPNSNDGYRMLVDRLWPRGVSKLEAKLDEWNKDIAPSAELRKWFDHKNERFSEFSKRYEAELQAKPEELERIRALSETKALTLLYGAKNTEANQALVLLKILTKHNDTQKL